jgi:hypothetical protein
MEKRASCGRFGRWALCAVLSSLTSPLLSTPLAAQVRQYTPPGGGADEAAGRKGALEKAVEEARWHAGPLRLDPAIWISDLAWVDSPSGGDDESGSDLTARAGAGLRGYLPIGSKSTLALYALPEYVWWKDRADERRWNQRFGIGSFTYFNRLAIAATAQRDEDFGFATGEILQRYTSRKEELALELEVPIVRRLSLFARGADITTESLVDGDVEPALADFFAGLDREDRSYRGGIRYYPNPRVRFGAGVGHSESEFAPGALDRSNSGDFWYVEAGYDRPKLAVDLVYEQNEFEAAAGSEFSDFDDSTGSARIEWRPRESFSARLYGSRQLAYSLLDAEASSFLDERFGAGVDVGLGWRLRLDLYAETGSHRYQALGIEAGGTGTDFVDDVESFGADLKVELIRKLSLRVGYQETRISSASGSGRPDQKISQLLANLGFGFGQGTWY